jgi:hypothetical protein
MASDYMEKKGRGADNLSLDRVNNDLGYVPGNVKVVTVSNNSRKRHTDYYMALQNESYPDPGPDPHENNPEINFRETEEYKAFKKQYEQDLPF